MVVSTIPATEMGLLIRRTSRAMLHPAGGDVRTTASGPPPSSSRPTSLTQDALKSAAAPFEGYLVCVTVRVWPAMIMVPTRSLFPLYRWTSTVALPLPVPDDTLPFSRNASRCTSVHWQPAWVVTAMVSVTASGPTFTDAGRIE